MELVIFWARAYEAIHGASTIKAKHDDLTENGMRLVCR